MVGIELSVIEVMSGRPSRQARRLHQQHQNHQHEHHGVGGLGIEILGQPLDDAEREAGDHRTDEPEPADGNSRKPFQYGHCAAGLLREDKRRDYDPGERAEARADAAGPGPAPGTTLGKDNCKTAEGLLPPEILAHYCKGEYENPVVEWKGFTFPPDFAASTEKNAGRFDLDAEGGIVDKATGKQPPRIYGFPFPKIDPSDPKAAAKAVCVRCDVRAECLEYALQWDPLCGVWGGLSERERRQLKRQRDRG